MALKDMRLNSERFSGGDKQLQEISLSSDTNILSVDLEQWQGISCRTEALYLLELFRDKKVKATFFVLSSVVEQDPDVVELIAREGHEIASHGGNHRQLFTMTPAEFRDDLKRSIDLLQKIVGKPILGYRAPHFSILEKSFWALDILIERGVRYDSSIFPIAGRRYGVPDFPRGAVRIQRGSKSIIEVPLSTIRRQGKNWPVSGGGYFRLLPYSIMNRVVRKINQEGLPFVIYCHPYEFGQERLRCVRDAAALGWWKTRKKEIQFNMFRKSMRSKFSKLLEEFRFCSFREALSNEIRR